MFRRLRIAYTDLGYSNRFHRNKQTGERLFGDKDWEIIQKCLTMCDSVLKRLEIKKNIDEYAEKYLENFGEFSDVNTVIESYFSALQDLIKDNTEYHMTYNLKGQYSSIQILDKNNRVVTIF